MALTALVSVAWFTTPAAQEMMAFPEPERFQAMLADAEAQLERMWEGSGR